MKIRQKYCIYHSAFIAENMDVIHFYPKDILPGRMKSGWLKISVVDTKLLLTFIKMYSNVIFYRKYVGNYFNSLVKLAIL
jgi:hypothetical protein